nr:MAG TPA: hypothetical protein [Bacteriophage sp.]
MLSLYLFLSRTKQSCGNVYSNSTRLSCRWRVDNYRASVLCVFIILNNIIKLNIIIVSIFMFILMIISCLYQTIHSSKVSRIILKRIFIIAFLLKSSSIILCRFGSKCCSVPIMHKSYIVLNKICVTLICGISLTIPTYSAVIMLSSSNSRSTVIRFICKLTHYIIVCSITVAISI